MVLKKPAMKASLSEAVMMPAGKEEAETERNMLSSEQKFMGSSSSADINPKS